MPKENKKILDSRGQPISSNTRNLKKYTGSIRTLLLSLAAALSVAAGVIGNIDKISLWLGLDAREFQVTDVLSYFDDELNSWVLDFRLLNNSSQTVVVNRLRLVVLSHNFESRVGAFSAPLSSAAIYEIPLDTLSYSSIQNPSSSSKEKYLEHPVSHEIQSGEADRFIAVIANEFNSTSSFHSVLVAHNWEVKPVLITSLGERVAQNVTIEVPTCDQLANSPLMPEWCQK